jgi:hypothetical protein
MRNKIFMVLVLGLFIGAIPGVALAGPGYSGDSNDAVDSEMWSVSGPIETGAVPEERIEHSLSDTHFNPFYPELRQIDGGGGGE